jgi:anti-sigma factor RsiW
MNCNKIRLLLEANADGELDLVHQLEVEEHLRSCPACASEARAIAARQDAFRNSIPRFTAPRQFRDKIQALVMAEVDSTRPRVVNRPESRWSYWYLGGMAAAAALALSVGYGLGNSRGRASSLLAEALSEHVRSLQDGHLIDVVSTDQHTVKPWFTGKIDFSPPVVDMADAGFPLVGGRLDRIDGRPAAALVFHRRQHPINLFVWPASGGVAPVREARENGYDAQSWSQGGLNFLAVSEIPPAELEKFIGEFRKRTQ